MSGDEYGDVVEPMNGIDTTATEDEPVDIGAAMADSTDCNESRTAEQNETQGADEVQEDANPSYPDLLTTAAHGLHEGYLAWDDIEIPDSLDVSEAQFESDVDQKIADLEDRHEPAPDPNETAERRDSNLNEGGVDWAALWEEFGFGTENANGDIYASKTQLRAAIQCSEQGISGDAAVLIKHAVDDGTLHKLTADGEYGETVERGYAFTEGER